MFIIRKRLQRDGISTRYFLLSNEDIILVSKPYNPDFLYTTSSVHSSMSCTSQLFATRLFATQNNKRGTLASTEPDWMRYSLELLVKYLKLHTAAERYRTVMKFSSVRTYLAEICVRCVLVCLIAAVLGLCSMLFILSVNTIFGQIFQLPSSGSSFGYRGIFLNYDAISNLIYCSLNINARTRWGTCPLNCGTHLRRRKRVSKRESEREGMSVLWFSN